MSWYMPDWEREKTLELIVRTHGVTIADRQRADLLVDRVCYSVNALFLTLQNGMGVGSGDVAGQFASGDFERVTAAMLAADIIRVGATKEVPEWDGGPSSDLGKVVTPHDIHAEDLKAAVDGYLSMLAYQAGVPDSAFGEATRRELRESMRQYVSLERRFAPTEPNVAPTL